MIREGQRLALPGFAKHLLLAWVLSLIGIALIGCAGHASTTLAARSALDAGQPREALRCLNEELKVESADGVPGKVEPDDYLYLLDRSMVLQELEQYENSSRDLELADKGIELLDFSRGTLDDVGKFLFSDDSGTYPAPAYEKLLINTVNMTNYLARRDLSGARVEARRLAVMEKFIADHENQGRALSAPGSYLAGFIFEQSGRPGEALRYYDEALSITPIDSLRAPICRLSKRDGYRSPRINALIDSCADEDFSTTEDSAELLLIVNYGRIPAKEAQRIPIGLALTMAAGDISPANHSKARELAAQGLVTWVNFPTMGKARGSFATPGASVDGNSVALETVLAVDKAAHEEWSRVQGKVIGSAIVRTLARVVSGEATRRVAGGGALGLILGLGVQATMTAVDTPDTRSWSTLPARMAFARLRVPAGKHSIALQARGRSKRETLTLTPGGWALSVLTVLR